MHELGIVFHIADSLLAVGRENNLTSISSVTIELGEVSGVVDSRRHFVRVLREDVSDRNLREGLSVLRQRKDTPGNRK